MDSRFHRVLHRIIEPQVLFPLSAVMTLLLIWGGTLSYVRMLRADHDLHARNSVQQTLGTYEVQVIRALDDIDGAMQLVKWWYEADDRHRIAELSERELLPSTLVFQVSLAGRDGRIFDSSAPGRNGELVDPELLAALRAGATIEVSRPREIPGDGLPVLQFGRRLAGPDGAFAGAVVVETEAAYFVSGYEESILGRRGLLALVGTDGVLRAQRSGEVMTAGGAFDYRPLLAGTDGGEVREMDARSSADGTARWVGAQSLPEFPLSVLVGMSIEEQREALQARIHDNYVIAGIVTVITLLSLLLLGRQSWQLMRVREREAQARQEHAERVEHLAYHDGLTGLANRSLFSRLLTQALARADRGDRQVAVIYLDLDRFKPINDTLGHEAGDQLLQEVSRRLTLCVRAGDTVARLGGDEFVVLLPESGHEAHIAAVAQKILDAVGRPVMLKGHEVRVTASVGIALSPRDGNDEQTLKKNADAAMYRAKAGGKNNFRFHTEDMGTSTLAHMSLEANLRHALEHGEFRIGFRARRDLDTATLVGREAVVYWEHPDLGRIPPERFMPIAEESGAIIAIGRWMLGAACEQAAVLGDALGTSSCIVLNLTAVQFQDERLVEDVRAALTRSGLAPRLLELQIPESALVQKPEQIRRRLAQLKELGVRIAVGDFGRSYAALSPQGEPVFDTIQIDAVTAGAAAGSTGQARLSEAVVVLARRFAATVVTPDAGVELHGGQQPGTEGKPATAPEMQSRAG